MDSLSGISGHFNLITKPEMRLPPRGKLKFTNMQIILSAFAEGDFCINGVIGAENATPKDFRIFMTKNQLRSFVAKALKSEDSKEVLLHEFFTDFLRSS